MLDMFGNEITAEEARRLLKRRDPIPQGYAAPPGTGPAGETCGSCRHIARLRYARIYLKCELNERAWTHGRKTDILARTPACRKWEAP